MRGNVRREGVASELHFREGMDGPLDTNHDRTCLFSAQHHHLGKGSLIVSGGILFTIRVFLLSVPDGARRLRIFSRHYFCICYRGEGSS